MFGNCNHCCFCCGHPCTMLGVSLFISCKNKIQCVCVEKKKKTRKLKDIEDRANTRIKKKKCKGLTKIAPCLNNIFWMSNSVLTSFRF